MKTDSSHINEYRNRDHPTYKSEDSLGMTGFYVIPISERDVAIIISSTGDDEAMPWEHVSVRIGEKHNRKLKERTPTWDEMCLIKEIFWENDECVMQLHPPMADWVNIHPHVLHLWRPTKLEIPRPPKVAV